MISREGWYMVKKITSGQVVERRKSYVGRKPSRRGARIKGNSGEKKQENNRQQAVLALARLLNCNYTHGDALLTLTFIDEALERCGGTFEGAVKEAKNFLDRIARRMKKHGDILKWVLVPSEVDGETGETALSGVSYTPSYFADHGEDAAPRYEILPVRTAITTNLFPSLNAAMTDTIAHLRTYTQSDFDSGK